MSVTVATATSSTSALSKTQLKKLKKRVLSNKHLWSVRDDNDNLVVCVCVCKEAQEANKEEFLAKRREKAVSHLSKRIADSIHLL